MGSFLWNSCVKQNNRDPSLIFFMPLTLESFGRPQDSFVVLFALPSGLLFDALEDDLRHSIRLLLRDG